MYQPITVSELSKEIKEIVESEFSFVYVTGEISNFKHHFASGHFYFTLKDEKAQINANMWNSRNRFLFFTPENGMRVIIKGRITMYESKGTYQIDVFEMQPSGTGELQIAFERLKQKLFEEGLFNEEFKKPIPEFPEKVGVVTSETGAALQDFLNVTSRRYPIVKVFLFHANVQGADSVRSICNAISNANKSSLNIDVLVLARGGGSIEDLWSFNDEKVAREIFKSKIPIVSAIGHEIDFTISDFVSDLRAPTPSAAAEMIFPDKEELVKNIFEYGVDLKSIIDTKLSNVKNTLSNFANNYYFKRPMDLINENKVRLDEINKLLGETVKDKFNNLKRHLEMNEKFLIGISPEQTLKRGFTLIIKDEKIISRKGQIKKEDFVEIKFYDGESEAVIKN